MLSVDESLKLLKNNGLPIAKSFLVKSKSEAVKQAGIVGYPVVLKLVSDEVSHKTDVGGVITGLNNDKALSDAYDELIKLSTKFKIKGLLVQEEFKGLELIIGIKKDPVFDQVIMTGIGGVMVELLKDVSFRVCPINGSEAKKMINELKANQLLTGFRGKPGINVNKLADLISQVSKLAVTKDIKEMDINPLIMKNSKALIVDARITV